MPRFQLLISDCFSFDIMFDIELPQTGHSDLLVNKLAMEKDAALLHSDTSPEY